MSGERMGEVRIGERLRAARLAAGLELAAVAERTRIRSGYLRALEAEAWDELPSGAHAKGFLRTYAELLGLDAEGLVDEYRRQVETEATPATPRGGHSAVAIGAAAGLVALGAVALVALVGGDQTRDSGREAGGGRGAKRADRGRARAPAGATVAVALRVHDPLEVCLVGGGGEALIDGQVLPPGDRERFERKHLQLRFPAGYDPGQLTLEVAGSKRRLPRLHGPAAFAISPPRHVRRAGRPPRERCP